tara:strand:- start:5198 stop:6931 length:1734 start_codon:yes stop_codon:yes gene_type:complete
MAEEKIVNLKINTNIDETTEDVNQLNTALGKTEKQVDNVNDAGKGTSKLTAGFNSAGTAIEGLSPGLKGAVSGMKAMLVQMWAIVANPIGLVVVAIVGALTLLYKAFTSTKEGGEKLEQIMAGLSAVIDIVRDRILIVGNAIVKFFSGDFKGALAEGKKAVKGFGAEIEKEFKQAANATKSLQQVEDAMRGLLVSRAKLDRDLAKSKELLTDENATYAQKVKALNEIKKGEAELTKQELANAEKKYNAIVLANSLSNTSREDLRKEAEAQAELYKVQQKSAEDNKSINKQEKRAQADELARLKEISAARKQSAKDLAAERKRIDDELTQSIVNNAKRLKDIEDAKVADAKNADAQLTAIAEANIAKKDAEMKAQGDYAAWELNLTKTNYEAGKKIRDKQIEDEKIASDARRQIRNLEIEGAQQLVAVLAGLFEKNKGIQKAALLANSALSIAQIINNTNVGSSKEVATKGILGLGTSAILYTKMGLSIASVLVATANGLKGLGGGGATSPSSTNSGGSGQRTGPSAPQFNVVGASGINQIAQLVGAEKPIVKAYVVASDITTAQALDRNIIKSSTLG